MNMDNWVRASACDAGHCVAVRKIPGVGLGSPTRFVRSSLGERRVIAITEEEWQMFIAGVKAGEFD
jgi:hypothetical protein